MAGADCWLPSLAPHGGPSRRGWIRLRTAVVPLLLGMVSALFPGRAAAHTDLHSADPGAGDHLAVAPRELRLTFTEAVELALARVSLTGPGGPVALAAATLHPDSATVLVAAIDGPLLAGTYTVNWQVAGTDGHPVRGEYSFVVAPGADGLHTALGPTAPGQPPPPTEHHDAVTFPTGAGGFGAESPLYAGVRWLTFLGLLGVIGVVAFRLVVLPRVDHREPAAIREIVPPAASRAIRIGMGAAALLAAALVLRLYAQSYALHGAGQALDPGMIATMLTRTIWGWGWLLQAVATMVALVGLLLARLGKRSGWPLAALGAVALAFSPALSGHAAASSEPGLAIILDALHVLSAGGWLGSLLLLVLAGIPVALRCAEGQRGVAVAALVNAFSPTALMFAALVVTTGVLAAWLQLGTVAALWESAWGRTLLLKLAFLALVFTLGAYNWRRVKPALGTESAAGQLRRSAALELAAGAVVLAVTAVLVATATPSTRGEQASESPTSALPPGS